MEARDRLLDQHERHAREMDRRNARALDALEAEGTLWMKVNWPRMKWGMAACAFFLAAAAPSCRDYNGGGPTNNFDPRRPDEVDEAWVPGPEL